MSEAHQALSRAQIFKQLDHSLARLKTDYVNLSQCYRYTATGERAADDLIQHAEQIVALFGR